MTIVIRLLSLILCLGMAGCDLFVTPGMQMDACQTACAKSGRSMVRWSFYDGCFCSGGEPDGGGR